MRDDVGEGGKTGEKHNKTRDSESDKEDRKKETEKTVYDGRAENAGSCSGERFK